MLVERREVVAERRQIGCDGEGGGAGADADDALAILLLGGARHALLDVVDLLVVGGDALESADGDRLGVRLVLFLVAAPAPRRLPPTVAGAAHEPRENLRLPRVP